MQTIRFLLCLVLLLPLGVSKGFASSAPVDSSEALSPIILAETPPSVPEQLNNQRQGHLQRFAQKRLKKKLNKHFRTSPSKMDRGLKSTLIWGVSALVLAAIASWLASAGLGVMGLLVGIVAFVVLVIALLKFLGWLSTQ
ncbi:MAG: hypothetical protein AAF399_23005 [Bacteroidota bacterium]